MTGRVAWVTGASRGLGAAIARRLVADGYHVVLSARDAQKLSALAAELGEACTRVVPVDVDDIGSVEAARDDLLAQGLTLTALIQAAGISARAPLDEPGAADVWERILRTNLDGTFHVIRAALPLLEAGGRIVNMASDLGRSGLAAYAAYCASKHGVIGLTRALALELAPRHITVNAVCPGWVETAMAEQGFAEIAQAVGADVAAVREAERLAVPLGRFATAAEVAGLVAYLLSDDAAMITGQALDLSGGTMMR
jgi:2-hydroxycyclohexanecarboxyl-CoA dehydrogenase